MSKRLDDGYQTLISFAANPAIKFFEKTVTPPSVEGGGEVDTTTMRNERWRTKNPKQLITLGESSLTVAYDPLVYPEIVEMVNVNQLITITFPDGDELEFFGWLDDFTPGENVEGEQPTADVTIMASNQDENGDEIEPVHTPAA